MQRRTYRPPQGKYSIVLAIAGGLVSTAVLFLAIPLSQKLADMLTPEAPPPPEIVETPPPPDFVTDTPPEEVEDEPPPEDDFVEEPMDLDLGLEAPDLPTGFGDGLALNLGNFDLADAADGSASNALDRPPSPVSKRDPIYPNSLRKKKVGGKVSVVCKVSSTGAVTSATVRSSSGQAALDQAALKAVRQWKFKPAIIGGKESAGTVVIPFNFEVR